MLREFTVRIFPGIGGYGYCVMSPLHVDECGFQYDPELGTELEIVFVIEGEDRTRVELEYRRLDRFGAYRDEMRAIFDKSGDWRRLLAHFAEVAAEARSQSEDAGR
jgi:hypothetical protein